MHDLITETRYQHPGIFMLETIWDAFGYSYECVSDEEWNDTYLGLMARNWPEGNFELHEQWLISRVWQQAIEGGWVDCLEECLSLLNEIE